jgi:hypothetical protein
MNNLITSNAFRVLSLAADADPKEVYRQEQRLQNAIEFDDIEVVRCFEFLPDLPLGREIVLEAVHRIEKQRLLEELFWVHDLDGKFKLRGKTSDALVVEFRADAGRNTIKGSVATHNLAVILTCLARELQGSRRFDYWNEALQCWTKTLESEVFWQFIEDRVETDCSNDGLAQLRGEARKVLQSALIDEVWSAVDNHDYAAIASSTQLALTHKQLLDSETTLRAVAAKLVNDGTVAVGGVLDRIANVTKDTEAAIARNALTSAEKDIRKIGADFEATLRAFGSIAESSGWDDARAIALEKLSIAYFNILDDEQESLRLVNDARNFAHDAEITEKIDRGWHHVQRAVLCSEGAALVDAGNFSGAEQKFSAAMALSREDQKDEIAKLQEACHRARIFRGVDTSKRNPSLHTINGIGTTFYGNRDSDQPTSTYVTTHWFTILYLPIIPIAAYRVSDAGGRSYNIHGRVPLSSFLKKYRWAVLVATVLLIIYSNFNGDGTSPQASSPAPSYSSSPSAGANIPMPTGLSEPDANNQPSSSNSQSAARAAESQAIEVDRSELKELSKSLDARKQQIDSEAAELQQMDSYMQSVKSTYTDDNLPESVRTQFNSNVRDYNAKAPGYHQAVREYNSDVQTYQQRIADFNTRINQYNANR